MIIDRETVIRLAREAGAGWRDHCAVDYYTFSPSQLERFAVLVLKYERKPLTAEQVKAVVVEAGYAWFIIQAQADFINGIRHGEAAHGITNKESSDAE